MKDKIRKVFIIFVLCVLCIIPAANVNAAKLSPRQKFISSLLKYNLYIKNHGIYFVDKPESKSLPKVYTFSRAKSLVNKKKKVNLDCTSSVNMALREIGYKTNSHYWARGDKLYNYSGKFASNSSVITSGIKGKKLIKVASKLKPGDILSMTGPNTGGNHTVVFYKYEGGHVYVFDSGTSTGTSCKRNGICKNYTNLAKQQTVAKAIRLKGNGKVDQGKIKAYCSNTNTGDYDPFKSFDEYESGMNYLTRNIVGSSDYYLLMSE